MERTLCLHGNGVPIEQEVTVVVSTSSIEDIFFDIRLFEVEDFALGVNDVGKVDWKATRNFRLCTIAIGENLLSSFFHRVAIHVVAEVLLT